MQRRNLLVLAAVLVAACGSNGVDAAPVPTVVQDELALPGADASKMVAQMEVGAPSPSMAVPAAGGAGQSAGDARVIVRTAEMALQVTDVNAMVQRVSELTAAGRGFLGASRRWREGEADRATLTLRVPAAALDATLASLRGLAVRVDNESVNGDDVTRQTVDLAAQLTNLRATEVELRALLATVRQRTQKAADVLEVHQQLSKVRGEIEQRSAELGSLTQLAALSTITLELRPDVVSAPLVVEDAWQPRGVARDAIRALATTGRVAINALIWLLVFGVPAALLGSGVALGLRRVWRWRRTALKPV